LALLAVSKTLTTDTPLFERLFCDFEIELYGEATVPKNGKIKVPPGPGLGLEPIPAVLERFRV